MLVLCNKTNTLCETITILALSYRPFTNGHTILIKLKSKGGILNSQTFLKGKILRYHHTYTNIDHIKTRHSISKVSPKELASTGSYEGKALLSLHYLQSKVVNILSK